MKKLTSENWDQHDETSGLFISINRKTDAERCLLGSGWANEILKPTLSNEVPDDLRELFEVARGAMVYGWFFYPMFTLGSQHLYFVHDAATMHKCKLVGAPPLSNFGRRIEWLGKNGYIAASQLKQWGAVRALRNGFAHADSQSIFSPPMAVTNVWIAAELLNALFSDDHAEEAVHRM